MFLNLFLRAREQYENFRFVFFRISHSYPLGAKDAPVGPGRSGAAGPAPAQARTGRASLSCLASIGEGWARNTYFKAIY